MAKYLLDTPDGSSIIVEISDVAAYYLNRLGCERGKFLLKSESNSLKCIGLAKEYKAEIPAATVRSLANKGIIEILETNGLDNPSSDTYWVVRFTKEGRKLAKSVENPYGL